MAARIPPQAVDYAGRIPENVPEALPLPSEFAPVVTLATIADQDGLAAMTVALNPPTIGGVTKTPSAVAFRVNGATTGLADPTDTGGTLFTPTKGGEYTFGGTVTIDGVVYPITPQTRTVGERDSKGQWWVTVYDDPRVSGSAVDLTGHVSGDPLTRTGVGSAGGDIDITLIYSATTLKTDADGFTLKGGSYSWIVALTDCYASWTPDTPTRAFMIAAAGHGTANDSSAVYFENGDGTEREGIEKVNNAGTRRWRHRQIVASTLTINNLSGTPTDSKSLIGLTRGSRNGFDLHALDATTDFATSPARSAFISRGVKPPATTDNWDTDGRVRFTGSEHGAVDQVAGGLLIQMVLP